MTLETVSLGTGGEQLMAFSRRRDLFNGPYRMTTADPTQHCSRAAWFIDARTRSSAVQHAIRLGYNLARPLSKAISKRRLIIGLT